MNPKAETEIHKKLFSYQLPLKDEIKITSEYPAKIKEYDNHLELLTEKSWIKIKTKQGYELKKISDKEFSVKSY